MSELSVKMSGDEAQLFASLVKVMNAASEAKTEFKRTAQESDSAANAAAEAAKAMAQTAQQGARLAQQLTKENESLEQAYERQKKTLEAAHQAGKISADQLATALQQLEARHHQQGEAQRQAAHEASTAWRQQNQAAQEGIAIVDRLEQETKSLAQQHAEMRVKIKAAYDAGKISAEQYHNSLERVNREAAAVNTIKGRLTQTMDNLGRSAVSQLTAMAAGWVSVQGAIGLARKAHEEFQLQADKGASETERLENSRRNLLQVSAGDFVEINQRADVGAVKNAVDRDVARNVFFTARSEGFEEDFEGILRLDRLIPAEHAARVAGQTSALFGREQNTEQIMAAVFKGAKESRKNFQQLVEDLPTAAEGAALTGGKAPETIAALSVLATQFNQPGMRIRALGSRLFLRPETSGLGLISGVEKVMGMDEESRKEFLGESQEVNAAYLRFAENMELIKERKAMIDAEIKLAGTPKAAIEQRLMEISSGPTQEAFFLAKQAKIMEQITAEGEFGRAAHQRTARRAIANADSNLEDRNWFVRLAGSAAMGVSELMGEDPGEQWTDKLSEKLDRQIEVLEKIMETQREPALVTRPGEDK